MKKIVLAVFIICLISNVKNYSQQVFEYDYPFSLLFKKFERINPYYIGNNPAYLFLDKEDELLTIHSLYNTTNGDFKKFIDPGEINNYEVGAFGKKSIGDSQVFKGSFGFQRTEYNDWQWIFTKDYSSGNPFLIGNTTTGNSRFNGIVMSAEYCNKLSDRFLLGTSLKYSVDEGLKEITPKPTSNHREIDFRVGAGYNFNEKISAGLVVNVFDNYENIVYSQDEEVVNQEVTLIKFRGFDFPHVFNKKSETRYSYNNGYLGDITFEYHLKNLVSFSAFAGGGFQKTMIKDDATDPAPDGFWKNDILRTGLYAASSIIEKVKLGVAFNLSDNNMWSSNPIYQSIYMENNYTVNSTLLGVEYSLNEKISMGIEAGTELIKRNDNDLYSQVYAESKLERISARLGIEIKWNDNISTLLAYGYLNQSVDESALAYKNQSEYFTKYMINDLLFYQTDYYEHAISLNANINSELMGIFKLYINYSAAKANNFNSGNNRRKNFQAGIEYSIKAY